MPFDAAGRQEKRARVAVAVSGGVDSLCALLLLRRAGYDVLALHGLFLPEQSASRPGGAADPLPGLEAACRTLDIPLHTVDLRAVFQREVIDPFARAYAEGRWPNPCALCNRAVKFGALLDAALALGADKLATGHYARLLPPCRRDADTLPVLAAARDSVKDQSYFLSLVPAARLQRALFPLADQDKAQSVALVAGAGLRVPLPRESQDICFVPDDEVAYRPFLAAQWRAQGMEPPGAGPVLLAERPEDGAGETREIGRHQGLWRYTEGQRKGLGIAHSEPLYVLRKDRVANALIVGPRSLLGMTACVTGAANILVPPEDWPEQVSARLRHRQRAAPARARLDARDRLHITLAAPQFPSAPGQVAALYDADGRVLAGGIVERLE